MAKEYHITTIIKVFSNGVKTRKDVEFCSDLKDALKQVDFNEKDLEYVNVLSYIIPAEGGCEELFDEEYYIGEVVDKKELTDYEISHAKCCHHDFIRVQDVDGYVRAVSGKIYMYLKGNNVLNLNEVKENNIEV